MKRPPTLRASFESLFADEMIVDSFAGGGGASTGIEAALGRPVDIAINHSAEAIAVHQANHPETQHFIKNVWEIDPKVACGSRRVGLFWASPTCTHFSRAKGATPLESKIRGLAWVVIRWAKAVRPRVIFLENVEEFEGWGPLVDGRPDESRAGKTFKAWVAKLKSMGYAVEWRSLVAADYGTPTTRRRLFLVARCDGMPIVWPDASHGKGRAEAWRPASDIINWGIPGRSIFGRERPLAEATMNRIAAGIQRYVINAANPFIVPVKSWGGGGNGARSIDEPMRTVTASKRGEFALVAPFIAPLTHQGGARGRSVEEPLATVTAAHRGELALASPFLVRHGHYSTITGAGLVEGCGAGTFRGQPVGAPLATVCATNDKHLVSPVLIKHYGGVVGHGVEKTLGTVTAIDHHSLAAAFLTKMYGTSTGSQMQLPLPTVTANNRGGGHLADVRAFLIKYYSANGRAQTQQLGLPLHTVPTKDRFGLVKIHGEDYQIEDVTIRMLDPDELKKAQGFRDDYNLAPDFNGKPMTKTAQIRLIGNSVCPQVAEAVVAANMRLRPARAA